MLKISINVIAKPHVKSKRKFFDCLSASSLLASIQRWLLKKNTKTATVLKKNNPKKAVRKNKIKAMRKNVLANCFPESIKKTVLNNKIYYCLKQSLLCYFNGFFLFFLLFKLYKLRYQKFSLNMLEQPKRIKNICTKTHFRLFFQLLIWSFSLTVTAAHY